MILHIFYIGSIGYELRELLELIDGGEGEEHSDLPGCLNLCISLIFIVSHHGDEVSS